MFKPSDVVIDAYLERLDAAFVAAFPEPEALPARRRLTPAARLVLTHLARTNALYTNLDSALLVGEVALQVLRGRQIERFDVGPEDWLHFVLAALACFTGFVRGVVPGDAGRCLVVEAGGRRVELERGRTDGCLLPWYVQRSRLFVEHYFHDDPLIEPARIADWIEYTRFPGDGEPVADNASWGALLRAAQTIALAADPRFRQRLKRFYRQLEEAGLAERMGYRGPADVIASYPQRFWDHLLPQIETALSYLKYTGDGQLWLARLNAHMLEEEHRD